MEEVKSELNIGQDKCYHPNPEDSGLLDIGRTLRDIPPAHYILKVDSFSFLVQLLEKAGKKRYESDAFEASGHKWKLCLYPNGDQERGGKGHISLYLAITNTEALPLGWEVNVSFKFLLFDQARDKYLTIRDINEKPRRYHAMKTEWGFSKLLPLSVFNDPTNGYLVGDKCVFGAEVFVIKYSGAGKLLPQPKNLADHVYTWNISNFSRLTSSVPAASFTLGDSIASCFSGTRSFWWLWRNPQNLGPVTDLSKGFLVRDTLVVKFKITHIFAVKRFA
ncbi:ubiquitin C-terminal hydrolase 13-like [Lycium barbarum]|uniref:ubiquitin C-terminal hydrolase 13-like n=1 Tax=Lycium barbarum TaxID=112863 RepID=UPI00293E74D3|nr:ubiquitin C-terminal hydrolase 13-like [Lycium barbarum]